MFRMSNENDMHLHSAKQVEREQYEQNGGPKMQAKIQAKTHKHGKP